MDVNSFLLYTMEIAVLIPGTIMCLLPFYDKLRINANLALAIIIGSGLALSAVGGYLRLRYQINTNFILTPFCIFLLILLLAFIKSKPLRTLYLFFTTTAITSSLRLCGYLMEASLDSTSNFWDVQRWGLVLRWGLTTIIFCIYILLLNKVHTLMVSQDIRRIWRFMWFVPFIFTFVNVMMVPHHYYYISQGRIAQIYLVVTIVLFVIHILVQVMFYYIVKIFTEKAKADAHAQMLSIQATQYESLQRHIEATSKLRHDFKHMARTAIALANDGDNDALIRLLSEYGGEIESANKRTIFSKNSTINALVGYYYEQAQASAITCDWQVHLPEKINIDDIDLCTIIGNLLENAIHASRDEDPQNRYITFKADLEDNGDIYIVATNGFSGTIKKDGNKYLSTKKDGSGIGLESIKSTAKRLNGAVKFYNDHNTFYADVMVKQAS